MPFCDRPDARCPKCSGKQGRLFGMAFAEPWQLSKIPKENVMTFRKTVSLLGVVFATTLLGGCMTTIPAMRAVPAGADDHTAGMAQIKDDLASIPVPVAASVEKPVVFTGIGFSQVQAQPGKSLNERRLMAIRAARMEALRDLTEQVHGIKLNAETSIKDQIVRNDSLRGSVEGEIRGARTVRITPKDNNTYEVVMELSPDTVRYLMRAARLGI